MATIRRFDYIAPAEPLACKLSDLYRAVFADIDELAVQRHLLLEHELWSVWSNHRVKKWVALVDDEPAGVAVITNQIAEWPLISPRYFARHFPEHYAADKIWYVGFVGVRPGNPGVFPDLVRAIAEQVIEGQGLAVMDFAHFNVAVRGIDKATQRILEQIDGRARGQEIDSQRFFMWQFPDEA